MHESVSSLIIVYAEKHGVVGQRLFSSDLLENVGCHLQIKMSVLSHT